MTSTKRFRRPITAVVAATFCMIIFLVALLMPGVGRAASLSVTKAAWKGKSQVLTIIGKGPSGKAISILDAETQDLMAAGAINAKGRWKVRVKLSESDDVACRIAASSDGDVVEKDVSAAPCQIVIDTAVWKKNKQKLLVRGKGFAGAQLELSDADTGKLMASAEVNKAGKWAALVKLEEDIPCRLTVVSSHALAEKDVKNAPQDCSQASDVKTLTALKIEGPSVIDENSRQRYHGQAQFSDGTRQDVTAEAAWQENSDFAIFDENGSLSTLEVDAEQQVTLTALYRFGGVEEEARLTVTIKDGDGGDNDLTGSHAGRFSTYQGSKTCMPCHRAQVREVHASVHYQWKGEAPDVLGANGLKLGKLGSINDFCTYPDINWIGKLTNTSGNQVDGGCAKCHVGMGAKPAPQATTAQLENIDCLVCHSDDYRRTVDEVNGTLRFVPDETAMPQGLLPAAVNIGLPSNKSCLKCHAYSGGGNNFKRGDLEAAQANPQKGLDVHMAAASKGGAGLACLDCHRTKAHRIAGRGTDLRPRDSADLLSCANCHGQNPHEEKKVDRHTARVNCTVCHIPQYARGAPTDLHRDWNRPAELVVAKGLFEPHMTMKSNVKPVYRFFNGMSRFYRFGEKAVPASNGLVLMSGPEGTVRDAGAKLYAFKHHRATQPADAASDRILPLKMGLIFQQGDTVKAAAAGAAAVGWTVPGLVYAETERYLGLFHQVAPKREALQCGSCHYGAKRLDFKALGYTPKANRNGRALCLSCHEDESDEWKGAEFFDKVHEKHVDDKKFNCKECHNFKAAG